MDCNKRLADYIVQNGITQTFIAKKTGLSVKVVNAIVNNSRKITADELGIICKALNVSADIFLA